MMMKKVTRFPGKKQLGYIYRSIERSYRIGTAGFRMEPGFFIVGAQKSGTSTLYKCLAHHPQIAPASNKEVHYYDQNGQKGRLWYRAHFPLKGRSSTITGEATPAYMYWPGCIPRIAEEWPNAKVIVLLRDPVERAISHYFHESRNGRESRPMLAAFKEEACISKYSRSLDSYKTNIPYQLLHYSYLDRGRYKNQLERINQHFSSQQVCLFESANFFRNPNQTLRRCAKFLDIDASYHFPDVEPTHVGGYDESSIDPDAYQYLVEQFAPENEKLFDYLGYQFDWVKTG